MNRTNWYTRQTTIDKIINPYRARYGIAGSLAVSIRIESDIHRDGSVPSATDFPPPIMGSTSSSDHRNNFNLLRFVFASMVILSHAPELRDGSRQHELLTRAFGTISFGELAVDSFFLLSGFLIVKSWLGRPDPITFLRSRILRIYPGFIASATVCALLVGPFFGSAHYFAGFEWMRFLRGLLTLQLASIPPVFSGSPYPLLNGALWTIPYEFKCYLLVLVCGAAGVLKRRWIWPALFVAAAATQVANSAGIIQFSFKAQCYVRFLMVFTAGGCFQLYARQIAWRGRFAMIALAAAAALAFSKILVEPAVCIFWGYAIFFYAMNGRALLAFNRLPDVSYGVYLYAWPINKIILSAYPQLNLLLLIPAVFLLSVIAGIASWNLVEAPFMKWKKRAAPVQRTAPAAISN